MKKLLSMLLAVSIILSMNTIAFAANSVGSGSTTSTGTTATTSTGFTDVPDDAWYAAGVKFCKEKGLVSGTSDTTFSPDLSMTRAMIAMIMYRAAGAPNVSTAQIGTKFKDVPDNTWYTTAVYWAKTAGIMNGYSADTFGPDDPVTREQIVVILWGYSGKKDVKADDFADEADISPWADKAVDWAKSTGIVSGRGGNNFVPQGTATRAEVASIFMRFIAG